MVCRPCSRPGHVHRRSPRRSIAVISGREARVVACRRRVPCLCARRHRASRCPSFQLHADRHRLVCRPVPCLQPPRQHGRPGRRRRTHRGGVPGRAAWALVRVRSVHVARCPRRCACRFSVLEPPAGTSIHGGLRQPLHRRDSRRRLARSCIPRADCFHQPNRAGSADPRRAAVRHGIRARAAPARRAERDARRNRPRVSSPGVAGVLRALGGPNPLLARPHRRSDRMGAGQVEHRRADTGRGALRCAGHPHGHLPCPCPRLQRRRLQGAAEIIVRAVSQGPRLQVARGRSAARSGSHHGLLLRRVPAAIRGVRISRISSRDSPRHFRSSWV